MAGDVSGRFVWRAGSELPSGPVVTPRRGSGNELNALRQQTAGQTVPTSHFSFVKAEREDRTG